MSRRDTTGRAGQQPVPALDALVALLRIEEFFRTPPRGAWSRDEVIHAPECELRACASTEATIAPCALGAQRSAAADAGVRMFEQLRILMRESRIDLGALLDHHRVVFAGSPSYGALPRPARPIFPHVRTRRQEERTLTSLGQTAQFAGLYAALLPAESTRRLEELLRSAYSEFTPTTLAGHTAGSLGGPDTWAVRSRWGRWALLSGRRPEQIDTLRERASAYTHLDPSEFPTGNECAQFGTDAQPGDGWGLALDPSAWSDPEFAQVWCGFPRIGERHSPEGRWVVVSCPAAFISLFSARTRVESDSWTEGHTRISPVRIAASRGDEEQRELLTLALELWREPRTDARARSFTEDLQCAQAALTRGVT